MPADAARPPAPDAPLAPDAAPTDAAQASGAQTPDAQVSADAATSSNAEAGNYWDYCPNCSSRLHNRGCKYRCPRCHYFMSCSDFD